MYEYDFEGIDLTDEQRQAVELGLVKIEVLNEKVKLILNKRAKDGWTAEYPFSVPYLWFKREVKVRKTRK